jgi:ABC-2 type transport system permease protein
MLTVFRKEISTFFSTLTGYVVIIVFLVANSLFMWIFKGNLNVLDSGYANLDTLFIMAPWIFLFLVPAITMRLFAEEKRGGTLELLLTQPIPDGHIVLAKYFAALLLILFSLLPTLVYFYSVCRLGSPPGNLDTGGILGSYVGLFFLAVVYASVGIFISSLTDNQIISFIVTVVISFFLYTGFDLITRMDLFGNLDNLLLKLGINEHYKSIRRGVIDTRDLVYFLSVISIFLIASSVVLKSRKRIHIIQPVIVMAMIVMINFIASLLFYRFDLTAEKRYSLSKETKVILRDLDEIVYVRVYLEGDLPVGFTRLNSAIRELLDEFRVYAPQNLQYEFIDPVADPDPQIRRNLFNQLYSSGLQPTNVQVRAKDGSISQKIVFPGAIISFEETDVAVNLLKNNPGLPGEVNLHQSIQSLEYEFISMIKTLSSDTIARVAFLEGQGELDAYQVGDITKDLANFYQVDRGAIGGRYGSLDDYQAVIIAKPVKVFSEADKFVIDQYIMKGGKVLWLLDPVQVSMDSLFMGMTFALYIPLNIEDHLVEDIQCHVIPVNKGLAGTQAQWEFRPWYYFPLISPRNDHPVTRSLNMIKIEFGSDIDTVGDNPAIKKTVLLATSPYSRVVAVPAEISLRETEQPPSQTEFNRSHLPLAILLEGNFESVFTNRSIPDVQSNEPIQFYGISQFTRMIVIADGDIIRNEVIESPNGPVIAPLGFDRYTSETFGNKDLILNAVNYLTDETGLISLRGREFRMRLLDRQRILEESDKWKIINTAVPVLLVISFGAGIGVYRRRRFR